MKELKFCKNCGKEFKPCHKTSQFCSKSCATSWRNKEKIKDGTHNFYLMDKGKAARDMVSNGTHPFQKGNMNEDALKRKAQGIREARLKESREHRHPWQNPKNYIENEYFLSLNKSKRRGLTLVHLYIADCEFENAFKIGWTYDLKIRENDPRCHDLRNLRQLKSGSPNEILMLERDIKATFYNEQYFKDYHSTEIFPNSIKEKIMSFINSDKPSTTIPKGSTP